MRLLLFLPLLALAACAGYESDPASGELGLAPATASGGTYQRDGFYDGGAADPDTASPLGLTR